MCKTSIGACGCACDLKNMGYDCLVAQACMQLSIEQMSSPSISTYGELNLELIKPFISETQTITLSL